MSKRSACRRIGCEAHTFEVGAIREKHAECVLRQIDWRLERIVASSEARVLDVPVARITLTTDGPEGVSSVSLQLDLTMVQKLREACEAIEANAVRPPVRKAR